MVSVLPSVATLEPAGTPEPLISVEGLTTRFETAAGPIMPSRDISFSIAPGEAVALVGESGSGKSVTGRAVLALLEPRKAIVAGKVIFKGENLLSLDAETLRRKRAQELAMIFQDPMAALNPVLTIGEQITRIHARHANPGMDSRKAAIDVLKRVGITDAEARMRQYPHQFSGGMQQRVMIAMALVCKPEFIVADEPTTALDVSIEAQVIALLNELRREMNMAMLFISHNLALVSQICDRVIVMYGGQIVEVADASTLFEKPRHPYTKGLIASIPRGNRRTNPLKSIGGEPPNLAQMPPGCPFQARCAWSVPACTQQQSLRSIGADGRVACHRAEELANV